MNKHEKDIKDRSLLNFKDNNGVSVLYTILKNFLRVFGFEMMKRKEHGTHSVF